MVMMSARARTVVVTGGASGIGQAVTARLRAQGCRVIIVDRKEADIVVDLSRQANRVAAVEAIAALSPDGIDGLVTCAGLGGEMGAGGVVSAVNFFGTTRVVQLLQPLLAKGTDPRVVVISSSTSVLPCDEELLRLYLADAEAEAVAHTADNTIAYSTGKRALSHWVRRTSVKPEWAGQGILVNGVAPGLIVTPLTRDTVNSPEGRTMLARLTPIAVADYPTPDLIAPLIAFLASPQCANMVGQIVFADGGSDVLLRGPSIP
jgi:NAD(P)-dependent dehydrogenase (short-subunit alcohol dehydrogenase family)